MENESQNVVQKASTVHPTSFIPTKAVLYPPRPMLASLQTIHIEVIHVIIFFLLTFCLFIGMWKRHGKR